MRQKFSLNNLFDWQILSIFTEIKSLKSNFIIASLSAILAACLPATCALFLFTGCTSPILHESDINESSARVAQVALAPVKVSRAISSTWNVGGEVDFLLEKKLQGYESMKLSSPSFLRAHQRVPAPSLWHGGDLGPARLLLPHDFLILVEITRYELKSDPSQGTKSTKPFYYSLDAYVRVIDLTGQDPHIAMQQSFQTKVAVSAAQVQTDRSLKNWTSQGYFGGAHAAIAAKLTQTIAPLIEQRIFQAWQRRLPLSRYSHQIHKKI